MLTFQIRKPRESYTNHSAPRRVLSSHKKTALNNLPAQQIDTIRAQLLERQLDGVWFKVGEQVRFKKPKRNPVWGTVVGIVTNPSECTFSESSGVPMNIILEVAKKDLDLGLQYGTERVKTNIKKLMYGVVRK